MRLARRLGIVTYVAVVMGIHASVWASDWDIALSGYGGLSHPPSRDLGVTVPGTFDVTGQNVSISDSAVLGGKLTFWSLKTYGPGPRMNFGIELEALQFRPNLQPQTVNMSGTVLGTPSTGTLTLTIPRDLQTEILAINFLARYTLNVTPNLPNGRWHVYFGPGGGVQTTRLRQAGLADQRDTSPMVQVLSGLKLFLTKNIGLFVEYKYTHTHHNFDSGPINYKINLDSNLFIAGASLHF